MSTVTRKIKNVVKQYTFAEIQVREATSNDNNWGPTPRQLDQLADLSHHNVAIVEMLGIIWKRLSERTVKNWRHVYKSLLVLYHLVKCGSEKVAQQSMERMDLLKSLSSYDLHEEGKDVGAMIRDKSKQIVSLLDDGDRLKNERAKMQSSKRIYKENAHFGKDLGSPGLQKDTMKTKKTKGVGSLPGSPVQFGSSDADYQLQLALKMSIEEHEEQERRRKLEEAGLQAALEESRRLPNSNGESPTGSNPDEDPENDRKPLGKRLTLLSIAKEHSFKRESLDEGNSFDPIEDGPKGRNHSYDPWEDLAAVFGTDVALAQSSGDPWNATDEKSDAGFGFGFENFSNVPPKTAAPQSGDFIWSDHYQAKSEMKLNDNSNTEATFTTTQTTTSSLQHQSKVMFSPTNPFYTTLMTHQLVSMPTNSWNAADSARSCHPVSGSDSFPWERGNSAVAQLSHCGPMFSSTRNGMEGEELTDLRPFDPSLNGKIPFSFVAGLPSDRQQTNPFL